MGFWHCGRQFHTNVSLTLSLDAGVWQRYGRAFQHGALQLVEDAVTCGTASATSAPHINQKQHLHVHCPGLDATDGS